MYMLFLADSVFAGLHNQRAHGAPQNILCAVRTKPMLVPVGSKYFCYITNWAFIFVMSPNFPYILFPLSRISVSHSTNKKFVFFTGVQLDIIFFLRETVVLWLAIKV
jgi:hypothetical protein